jgi:uncharacterized protein (DUF1697 family)
MTQPEGFLVLLRGVNVGKGRRVPMADFKAVLAGLGLQNVQTLLNSGNAVAWAGARRISAATLAREIAAALQAHFGFAVPVIVKTAAELQTVVAENRLADELAADGALEPSRLFIAFAQEAAQAIALGAPLQALLGPADRLHVGTQALYLFCADGVLKSKAGDALLGKQGSALTSRNWATVLKLQALLEAAER